MKRQLNGEIRSLCRHDRTRRWPPPTRRKRRELPHRERRRRTTSSTAASGGRPAWSTRVQKVIIPDGQERPNAQG